MGVFRVSKKLYMKFVGNKVLALGALYGFYLLVCGILGENYGGFEISGIWEQIFSILTGTAVILSFGGTLVVLYYKKLKNSVRYWFRITVRISSMLLGPLITGAKYSYFMENGGVWPCAMLCCITIIPFGISLIVLIVERGK